MVRYGAIVLASLATILLYLLAIASGSTSHLSEYYWELFALNSLLAAGLGTLIWRHLWHLRAEVRSRVFGAKLTLKMVAMFALVAILPGLLLFTVSVQFLNRSIESWFNVRVEAALDRGLNLGRNALDYVLNEQVNKGNYAAQALSSQRSGVMGSILELSRLREQLGVDEMALFDVSGTVLAVAGGSADSHALLRPTPTMLQAMHVSGVYKAIEPMAGKGLILRVVLPVRALSWGPDERILQLIHPAPAEIADDALLVETTRAEYRQLALSRDGLKQFYSLTLGLTLLLSLLAAVGLGMLLSRRISAPLSDLAAGTRAVAQGDFTKKHTVHRRDELGMLTAMFNRMTKQLAEARETADASHAEITAHKVYLETILGNLSAGVLAFDREYVLRAANPSAERILGQALDDSETQPLVEWGGRSPILAPLANVLVAHANDPEGQDWQQEIIFPGVGEERVLLARGTRLPEIGGGGLLLVFDDITSLVRAQRDAAWGEVAKRLAHEIRNPLTPIQLSAERLQMKLSDKLSSTDADFLKRCTDTIVKQVTALKGMVDAFRDYARAPRTQLAPVMLRTVINEVFTLYESHPAFVVNLCDSELPIMGDSALLRQVLHNLFANAQDAVLDETRPMIHISSSIKNNAVVIEVEDNGPGFSPDVLPRAFEPYVTNKSKGTGLGLAVVKKIIEEHHGSISIENVVPHGARLIVTLPLLEIS